MFITEFLFWDYLGSPMLNYDLLLMVLIMNLGLLIGGNSFYCLDIVFLINDFSKGFYMCN